MYEQVEKPKENKGRTVADSVTQKKNNGLQAFGFVDNRPDIIVQKKLQEKVNKGPQTIQLKDIHDTVFYGHTTARRPYLATDKSDDHSMPHLTVDTLNHAIGLSNETMVGGLDHKRMTIRNVVNQPIGNLSNEEFAWVNWLRARLEVLLLPSMTGVQCRTDMKMDDSWLERLRSVFNTPTRHTIAGRNGSEWQQENHSVNVVDGIDEVKEAYYINEERYAWTDLQRNSHDALARDLTPLEDDLFPVEDVRNQIEYRTTYWLGQSGPVLNRFWRLTSKMGIDFFTDLGKHVAFVRNANQPEHIAHGRRSITDSEWGHANQQGNIGDQTVTRHEPI